MLVPWFPLLLTPGPANFGFDDLVKLECFHILQNKNVYCFFIAQAKQYGEIVKYVLAITTIKMVRENKSLISAWLSDYYRAQNRVPLVQRKTNLRCEWKSIWELL